MIFCAPRAMGPLEGRPRAAHVGACWGAVPARLPFVFVPSPLLIGD